MTHLLIGDWRGATVIGPESDLEATLDGAPPITLTVDGGELVWPWQYDEAGELDATATLTRPPVAVLDDLPEAQTWLWAMFGSAAALALDSGESGVDGTPRDPWVPETAARLAFGLWLSAWWPASVLDGIPALDPGRWRSELAPLVARLDLLFGEHTPALPESAEARVPVDRYALAAGTRDELADPPLGAVLVTGVAGVDWSDCPAGWVDSSAAAVSWRMLDDLGRWSIQVRVAAGPARVSDAATLSAELGGVRVELRPGSDPLGRCWLGACHGVGVAPGITGVRVLLPGFAATVRSTDVAGWQERVRVLARHRRYGADHGPAAPWWAEDVDDERS